LDKSYDATDYVTWALRALNSTRQGSHLRSWEHMFEQGVVAKKLELAETMALFSFFQNIANAVSWRRDTKFDYLKPTNGYPGGYYIVPVVPKWRNVGHHNFSQKITTHAFEWLYVLIIPMRMTMAKKIMRIYTAVK
jgi:hypothetical protein